MTKQYKLSDGTTTINLLDDAYGFSVAKKGHNASKLYLDNSLSGINELEFALSVKLVLRSVDHDDAADQLQDLIALLYQAWKYRNWPAMQSKPIYIIEQTEDETEARYAVVKDSTIQIPSAMQKRFDANVLEEIKLTLTRGVWQAGAPGAYPSSLVTVTASNGAASPTHVHVSNHRDDVSITHAYIADASGGPSFTAISTGTTLFPATVAQNDYLIFGSTDNAFKTLVIPALGTAGNLTTTTLALKYYDGAAWTALTLGDDYTCFPGASLEACLEQSSDDIVISVSPPSDWTKTTLNAINAYWLKIEETNAAPSYATRPVTNTDDSHYAQRAPYVEIPSTALGGDHFPFLCMRMKTPAGGDADETFANTSRILIGSRSRHLGSNEFVSRLNANSDNPTGWAASLGTDASSVNDPEAPGGTHVSIDFSTTESLAKRLTITGTDKLPYFEGTYRPFLLVQQSGGDAEDVEVKLRVRIGSTDDYAPKHDLPVETEPLTAVDKGVEAIELPILRIPFFSRKLNADTLTGVDLIFEVWAEIATGSAATLEIHGIELMPIDEGFIGLDDPVSDTSYGNSALRGDCMLEVDNGIVHNRTIKMIKDSTNWILAETWSRQGVGLRIEPARQTRLYFMMFHYADTWGEPPLICSPGMHLQFEMYERDVFFNLRGDA